MDELIKEATIRTKHCAAGARRRVKLLQGVQDFKLSAGKVARARTDEARNRALDELEDRRRQRQIGIDNMRAHLEDCEACR